LEQKRLRGAGALTSTTVDVGGAGLSPGTGAKTTANAHKLRQSLGYLSFILPAGLMCAVFLLYPIVDTFWLSFHNVNEFGQVQGFAGLGNFLHVLRDPAFRGSLIRSAIWTLAVVVVTTALSLFIAAVLNQPWRGRGFVRGILLLPWASSLVVTTLLWQWIADPDFGALNHLGHDLGLLTTKVAWLGSANTALPLMIWIAIWVSVPPTSLIILAGLQGINRDVYDAAALDKTRGGRLFFDITLPLLRPVLTVSVLLNVIFVFNSFPIIWILTQGGPVGTTNTLPTYMYNLGFELYEMGEAAAVAVIMFLVLLVFSVVYTRVSWKSLTK
jgi:multiple sugar transport system permease protein